MSAVSATAEALAVTLACWAAGAWFLTARLLSTDGRGWRTLGLRVVWPVQCIGIFWLIAAWVAISQPSVVNPFTLALVTTFAVGGSFLLGYVARLREPPAS
jgi:hypothetical protein